MIYAKIDKKDYFENKLYIVERIYLSMGKDCIFVEN